MQSCDDGWITDNLYKKCYYVSPTNEHTWTNANEECKKMDAQLIELIDEAKAKRIAALGTGNVVIKDDANRQKLTKCYHSNHRTCQFQIIRILQVPWKFSVTSGQSYKASTIVIYDSRLENTPHYDSIVVNYERKLFIRLATDLAKFRHLGKNFKNIS